MIFIKKRKKFKPVHLKNAYMYDLTKLFEIKL